jgi:Tfp pilus assembly protein PilW
MSVKDEGGLSLIELIIYILVLGVIMSGLVVMLVNMWKTQVTVDAQTQATNNGQLVTSEVERAMRNATGFKVTDGGSTLLVETSLPGSRQCEAFHVADPGGSYPTGALQLVVSAPAAPAATSGYAWQKGISAHTDGSFTAFFTGVDASGAADAATPKGVHYSFAATAPAASTASGPVIFTGTAFPRNTTLGGTSTCWP